MIMLTMILTMIALIMIMITLMIIPFGAEGQSVQEAAFDFLLFPRHEFMSFTTVLLRPFFAFLLTAFLILLPSRRTPWAAEVQKPESFKTKQTLQSEGEATAFEKRLLGYDEICKWMSL